MKLINIINGLAKAVNYITPKRKKKVMFASFPDFADNARALYEFMSSHERFNDFTFVWLVSPNYKPTEHRNTIFIRVPENHKGKAYLKYLFHLITAKYLFCTHGSFVEAVPSRQVSVLLWHGTMLKRIGAMNEREKSKGGKKQYRFYVSPSRYYVSYFCKSFLCSEDSVITCGYPRNDLLFKATDVLYRLNIEAKSYNKIIVYMPTFRTPLGGDYSDSINNKQMCFDIEDSTAMRRLSDYLVERGMLLIIKWHPSDVRQSLSLRLNNILAINNHDLERIEAQVYQLLHYADALITDYSSVFCDYLLLDRPVAFDVSDIESYSDKRGFVFDEPLNYMPGVKLYDEADFLSFCDDIANGIDHSKNKRDELKFVYNDFFDGNNCQRLLQVLALLR